MITTAPRLLIRRPSPTTADFAVTTRPESWGVWGALLGVTRLALSLTTLLFVHACAADTLALHLGDTASVLSRRYRASATGQLFTRGAAAVSPPVAVVVVLLAVYALSRRVHAHESLLVLRGLGVQTTESAASYLSGAATRFIPTEKIQDILVNEAFRGFEVRYHLVVVVEGEEDLVVVFPGLLPRRRIVEEVWRGARECLYEAKRDDS